MDEEFKTQQRTPDLWENFLDEAESTAYGIIYSVCTKKEIDPIQFIVKLKNNNELLERFCSIHSLDSSHIT